MEFEPDRFQQMAGLVCYYNGCKFHYLYVSHDADLGKHIQIMSCLPDQLQSDVFSAPVGIPTGAPVHLRVEVDFERRYLAYRIEGREWSRLPGPLDASILSDEARLLERPISLGHLSVSVARTWPVPAGRRISTISCTASGVIAPNRSAWNSYFESSTTSMPFTHAIPAMGTKVSRILPWALGRIAEKVRSIGRPSPPASLMISKPLSRATPLQ